MTFDLEASGRRLQCPQWWMLAATLAALVLGGSTLALSEAQLLSRWLHDDSFYYLEIARNLALGNGPTFDGLHPTNGFQPLYQIAIAPAFWIDSRPEAGLQMVRVLEILFFAGAAALLFRLVWELTGGRAPAALLSVAVLFIPAPDKGLPICRSFLNGMESSLNALMILALLNLFVVAWKRGADAGKWFFAAYGTVAGLTFLARLDNVFLLAAIGVAHLFQLRAVREFRRSLPKRLGGAGLICAGIAGVYLAWNLIEFGHLVPVSGRVKAWLSELTTERLLSQGFGAWVDNTLWFEQRWPTGAVALGGLLAVPVLVLARLARLAPKLAGAAGRGLESLSAVQKSVLSVVFVSSLARVSYYAIFQQYPESSRIWYYTQELLVLAAVFGLSSGWTLRRLTGQRAPRWSALALGTCCMLGVISSLSAPASDDWETGSVVAVAEVRKLLGPEAVLAAESAGVLGFFLPNPVVNIDGLVNDEHFFDYLRRDAVREYIQTERIGYLLDLVKPGVVARVWDKMGAESVRLVWRSERPTRRGHYHELYEVLGVSP